MLAHERENAKRFVTDHAVRSSRPRFPHVTKSPAELEAVAHEDWWDKRAFPFVPLFSMDDGEPACGVISDGDVTRERLAHHLRAHNKDQHDLHGSLGRAFDILNVEAGLADPLELPSREYNGLFVAKADLRKEFKQAGVSNDAIRAFNKIMYGDVVHRQWNTPIKHPEEIIFEGEVRLDTERLEVEYDEVAIESLLYLRRSPRSKIGPILHQMIASSS